MSLCEKSLHSRAVHFDKSFVKHTFATFVTFKTLVLIHDNFSLRRIKMFCSKITNCSVTIVVIRSSTRDLWPELSTIIYLHYTFVSFAIDCDAWPLFLLNTLYWDSIMTGYVNYRIICDRVYGKKPAKYELIYNHFWYIFGI